MRMPAQPISAISFHAARSKPSALPLSRTLRKAVTGDFSDTHDLAPSRIIVCSSFMTAIFLFLSLFVFCDPPPPPPSVVPLPRFAVEDQGGAFLTGGPKVPRCAWR